MHHYAWLFMGILEILIHISIFLQEAFYLLSYLSQQGNKIVTLFITLSVGVLLLHSYIPNDVA